MTAFVVGLVATLACCAGLAVDGGRVLAASLEAADHAENAGRRVVDPGAAARVVSDYLDAVGLDGEVAVTGRTVAVTVRREVAMTLLGLVGVDARVVEVTRVVTARDG
jgi:hypothetical protein